jgi:hypothetical protein
MKYSEKWLINIKIFIWIISWANIFMTEEQSTEKYYKMFLKMAHYNKKNIIKLL